MKKILIPLLLVAFAMNAFSQSVEDATAMVKKAVVFYKQNGREAALKEFSNKTGQFVKGELYLTVWSPDGTQIAHGANEKLIGKNLIDLKDPDGKEFVKEFIKIKENGWVEYKWTHPVSKKIAPKKVYLEKVDDILIGAGVYLK